jgi:hypothetical protein
MGHCFTGLGDLSILLDHKVMKTVLSRKDLKTTTERFVFVQREKSIYIRAGDEYVKKRYFEVSEVADTLGLTLLQVHRYCRKFGIQAPANKRKKIRITLPQLQRMAEAQTKIQI